MMIGNKRRMNSKEERLFRETMQIQTKWRFTEPMQRFIARKAREYGATTWVKDGNVYVRKGPGTPYPCVVAHTDTVHNTVRQFEVHRDQVGMWWAGDRATAYVDPKTGDTTLNQVGIGGDDKVGIYIALTMIRTHATIKGFFPRDEEIGCAGSACADMSFFDDVSLVIQNDRRGTGDCVREISGLDLSSEAFQGAAQPILDAHGFRFCSGVMTDVQELKERGLGVCATNLSCGYHAPHTNQETVDEHEMLIAQDVTEAIIDQLGYTRRWEHVDIGECRWWQTWPASHLANDDEGYWDKTGRGTYRYTGKGKASISHTSKHSLTVNHQPLALEAGDDDIAERMTATVRGLNPNMDDESVAEIVGLWRESEDDAERDGVTRTLDRCPHCSAPPETVWWDATESSWFCTECYSLIETHWNDEEIDIMARRYARMEAADELAELDDG